MSTAVNNSALNSAVSNYTYSYQGKYQAKLDKDDNATWDRSELQAYADAYNKATGQSLDVDALMEKYANEDGVIDYKSQQSMQADDALGLSVLQSTYNAAKASSGTTTSTSTSTETETATRTQSQQQAALSAVSQYTYSYSGKFQPLLDKNDDGMWSREELDNYAEAYNKATGKTLDVDALIKQYGNDEGYIDPTNQSLMKKNDALGLTALKSAYDDAIANPVKAATNKEVVYWDDVKKSGSSASDYSIEDLLSTMSPERKMAYSVAVNRLDTQSSMLNTMLGSSGNPFSAFDISSTMNNYRLSAIETGTSSGSLYNAMSGNALNFTI